MLLTGMGNGTGIPGLGTGIGTDSFGTIGTGTLIVGTGSPVPCPPLVVNIVAD